MARMVKVWLASIGALLLSACFVSEAPLLTDKNARSRPLKPGPHVFCPVDDPDGENRQGDCEAVVVTRADDASYVVTPLEEAEPGSVEAQMPDALILRFRRVARRGWLGQMTATDDPEAIYVYARGEKDGVFITVLWCPDALAERVEPFVEAGAVTRRGGSIDLVCSVSGVEPLEAVARAYHRREVKARNGVLLTRRTDR
ncbi:MAG: hypothetical protein AAGC56_07785 [Pseudomonadota bacterium]